MNLRTIKLDQLQASDVNPRFMADPDAVHTLTELAESIKANGVLQPLIVSEAKDGYRIVAGHRRAMAASIAGLKDVPCVVRPVKNIEVAHLVENVQREDLSAAESGQAVYNVLKAKKLKAKDLAKQLGKSEAWISKARTIGEAATKATPNSINQERLLQATNADDAYSLALEILGRKKEPKLSTQRTSERPAPELMPDDLEKRWELWLQRTWGHLPEPVATLKTIQQSGRTGEVHITISFKTEVVALNFAGIYCPRQ
jgi:ParB/RepB/Spo0J family partition protein